ncbi:hydroxymethylpyrimidine/phosphomethylpyrimidine kinase [Puniceicoccaceae bacterium K14]|nr:hydroxymethylpyrimidine/phosphomethylpyrimidine kinase [Puniceicoccaceae bacterium K14]
MNEQGQNFVLTISGSDSSGGAGMQADNRAILAAGAFPLNVVTAITLQTPEGVEEVDLVDVERVRLHTRRLLDLYPVKSIKGGMLGSLDIATAVAEILMDFPDIPYVLDPVLASTSGHDLLDPKALAYLRETLMPRAVLITPNLQELYALSEQPREVPPLVAAQGLAKYIKRFVLLKGGHFFGAQCEDWLVNPDGGQEVFAGERIESKNVRGTGCALSSLIAAHLAGGSSVPAAVLKAKRELESSIRSMADRPWEGPGPAYL